METVRIEKGCMKHGYGLLSQPCASNIGNFYAAQTLLSRDHLGEVEQAELIPRNIDINGVSKLIASLRLARRQHQIAKLFPSS